jgi:hypothetical protein
VAATKSAIRAARALCAGVGNPSDFPCIYGLLSM